MYIQQISKVEHRQNVEKQVEVLGCQLFEVSKENYKKTMKIRQF